MEIHYLDLEKISNLEYSSEEEGDDDIKERRYLVNTIKIFFGNEMLKFIHRGVYQINNLLKRKDSRDIDDFMNYIADKKTVTNEDEKKSITEFQEYLKYRIILNKDFRFKDEEKQRDFTYNLKLDDGKLNEVFTSEDVDSFLKEIPVFEKIKDNRNIPKELEQMKYQLNFKSIMRKIEDVKKLKRDEKNSL